MYVPAVFRMFVVPHVDDFLVLIFWCWARDAGFVEGVIGSGYEVS